MCSVVGYIGKNLCASSILEGLARLEYRGYDSAGFACLDNVSTDISYVKSIGPLSSMITLLEKDPIDGVVGIGHTRWSTHGNFSIVNAHPHFDCTKTISVVHNGIIENYAALKKELLAMGHVFSSDTDTEVIPHLFESILNTHTNFVEAVIVAVNRMQGAYACAIIAKQQSDMLLVIRKKSPLCIGVGEDEMFVASDVVAFANKTDKVIFIPDESFALVYKEYIELYDFLGNRIVYNVKMLPKSSFALNKDGYEHFMLKEIFEQKEAIKRTVQGCKELANTIFEQLGFNSDQVKTCQRICFIACGSSFHAALMARFFFEEVSGIAVDVHIASEFQYKSFFSSEDMIYVALSQSGETADVLEVVRLLNAQGCTVIAITNSPTSTLAREVAGFLLTHAGVEVAVAATKSFSTQLAALYWLAYCIAYVRGVMSVADVHTAEQDLIKVAYLLESLLDQYKHEITMLYAPRYADYKGALFVGKNSSYPLALEAALKIKEIAYVFAQAYPAGELKHGALALVDNTVPVYLFSHQNELIYNKLLSNAHTIKARGGRLIVFAYAGQDELIGIAETVFICPNDIPVHLGSMAMLGLIQFFAYAIAIQRGCSIDKPRNLAKSVTVE